MSKKVCVPSLLLIVIVLLSFASCTTTKTNIYIDELTQNPNKKSDNKLEQITNLWVGHFSNKAFVEANSDKGGEQEVICRRIWKKERFGEYWIYAGWFQTDSYESALSSSIAQITKISPDTAFITFYRIKEGLNIDEYEWRKDAPFDNLKTTDLESSGEKCGSYLVKTTDGDYEAIAHGPCYSPMSADLKYYKIDAVLKNKGIFFNTKFLDAQFNVLIGYKNNAFLRLNKAELERKYENFVLAD